MRTYSWTVPREERTLMVLGYMTGRARPGGGCPGPHGSHYHDRLRRNQGEYPRNGGDDPFPVVTTILEARGGRTRRKGRKTRGSLARGRSALAVSPQTWASSVWPVVFS